MTATVVPTNEITREDLGTMLTSHKGNDLFRTALQKANTALGLYKVFGQYTIFNSVFGGGVANLAGEIAERQDILYDETEPVKAYADRSVIVAAQVYAASVAEFGGETAEFNHRSLAQANLKGMGEYFHIDSRTANTLLDPTSKLSAAMKRVQRGYGVNRYLIDVDLFEGIGFHMGSECLADQEFNVLHEELLANWPDLVDYLKHAKVSVGGEKPHPAYNWVIIHTTVEADHFAYATVGANLALQYYHGPFSKEQMKNAVLAGFTKFAAVQAEFMQSLIEAAASEAVTQQN